MPFFFFKDNKTNKKLCGQSTICLCFNFINSYILRPLTVKKFSKCEPVYWFYFTPSCNPLLLLRGVPHISAGCCYLQLSIPQGNQKKISCSFRKPERYETKTKTKHYWSQWLEWRIQEKVVREKPERNAINITWKKTYWFVLWVARKHGYTRRNKKPSKW